MSTITLYKDKVNGVGSLLDDIIKSSNNLNTQLGTLKNTIQGVNSSTCDLQSTVDSISSSSKSEDEKVEDLKKLNNKLTEFIEMTDKRDESARDAINQAKKDFYSKYSYLKPECEKSVLEHIADDLKSVAEWCKEHWKLIATIVIVAVAIVLLCTGVGSGLGATLIAGACWGAITGAVIGGVSGGLDSMANGGSFLDGFEDGAFSGAVGGAIGGAAFAGLGQLGAVLGKGIKCMSTLGKFVKGTAAVTKVMSTAMGGFDTIALLDKAFGSGDIASLNAKLHENKAYNYFQTGVSATAVLTNGMTSTMKCFVAGTLVATINGLVAIENIKAGDYVLSTNPDTMETAYKPVLETYVRETDKLVHLTINGEEIITTFDHPFYVNGKGFINASMLWIGAELVNNNGDILLAEKIYREFLDNKIEKVYNFKVEDNHTYHVGEHGVLVHNAEYIESKIPVGKKDIDQFREKYSVSKDNTIAIGKTNVPGLEGMTFEGSSPKVRKMIGLQDLDVEMPNRSIKAPGKNPLFTRHAEEVVANKFDIAIKKAGISPEKVTGELHIHQSNPSGVCPKCLQGLSNDKVAPGVLKQLSLKYPNLLINVSSEVQTGVKVRGRSFFQVKNGHYI